MIFVLQTCVVCVFRWLIFSSFNHNLYLCHHMSNIVQYRATTCSLQFVVVYRGCQYVDSGSTVKYHIIGNICLPTSMGAKRGWCCVRVWLYFAKELFQQAANFFYIRGSMHCESNLITVQQDATYSVYYFSVGIFACFGCWHPSSGARKL